MTRDDLPDNETRRRVLEAAEALFAERGYGAVRLRDIAQAVGMRHASLYYYAPGGKEQLFAAVVEHHFARHRVGLETAIATSATAGGGVREQIRAIARWFAAEPQIDLAAARGPEGPALEARELRRLQVLAFRSLRDPLVAVLDRAQAAGEVALPDVELAALALASLVASVHAIPVPDVPGSRGEIAERLADMLLDGWRPR